MSNFNVTDVRINQYEGQGGLKGFVSVTLNESLVIKDLVIRDGRDGLFVGFPQSKSKTEEKYYDRLFFLDRKDYDAVSAAVLAKYSEDGGAPSTSSGGAKASNAGGGGKASVPYDAPPANNASTQAVW